MRASQYFTQCPLVAETCLVNHSLPCRNNSKLREKAKKEEGKRLRQFVDDAYRLDTRILRRKQNLINER